jgi:hypothetical protein
VFTSRPTITLKVNLIPTIDHEGDDNSLPAAESNFVSPPPPPLLRNIRKQRQHTKRKHLVSQLLKILRPINKNKKVKASPTDLTGIVILGGIGSFVPFRCALKFCTSDTKIKMLKVISVALASLWKAQ